MDTSSPSQTAPTTSTFPTDPAEFSTDTRISFSRLENKYLLEAEDGTEYEFDHALKRWIPVVDESLLAEQQKAYQVAGVDESEPVDAQRHKKKRKQEYVNGQNPNGDGRLHRSSSNGNGNNDHDGNRPSKKAKPPSAPRVNTAIYVTGIPHDVTVEEVHEVFSRKCGVIAEEIDSGKPRIKLYTDEQGNFKGDALIVFFKAPSVDMAIMLLDDTEFRVSTSGEGSGRMRVQVADASYKKVQHEAGSGETGNGQKAGTTAGKGTDKERQRRSAQDKAKIIKKTQKLDARLADWSDDEPSALAETSSRWDRVVILKHMFTLRELEEDPAALLEIKEDIRDECGKLGAVTNVVLFDREPAGVASVRFANSEAARACVRLMNGRSFAGQKVEAYISDGKEQFLKSKSKDNGAHQSDSDDE